MDVHAVTRNETRRRDEGIVFLVLFALTIPAANWLIRHVGTVCQPAGPCLVPVAPGLMAPSGVIMAGAALVLRDLVQRRLGATTSSLAILVGAVLSAMLAPPALVVASAAVGVDRAAARSFLPFDLVTEAEWAMRAGIKMRLAAGGTFLDQQLALRRGVPEGLGQIVGKAWMVLLSIPFVAWLRRRDERLGFASS